MAQSVRHRKLWLGLLFILFIPTPFIASVVYIDRTNLSHYSEERERQNIAIASTDYDERAYSMGRAVTLSFRPFEAGAMFCISPPITFSSLVNHDYRDIINEYILRPADFETEFCLGDRSVGRFAGYLTRNPIRYGKTSQFDVTLTIEQEGFHFIDIAVLAVNAEFSCATNKAQRWAIIFAREGKFVISPLSAEDDLLNKRRVMSKWVKVNLRASQPEIIGSEQYRAQIARDTARLAAVYL